MLRERIEGKWIDCFAEVFGRCGVAAGDAVRGPVGNAVAGGERAARRAGAAQAGRARRSTSIVPTPRQRAPVPVRSTGACDALQRLGPVVERAGAVGDSWPTARSRACCTRPSCREILKGGARVLMVSNEHPESSSACRPTPALEERGEGRPCAA